MTATIKILSGDIIQTFGSVDADVILDISLMMYYCCWVFGCGSDIKAFNLAVKDVDISKRTLGTFGCCVMISVAFVGVMLARTYVAICGFLLGLLVVDLLLWKYGTVPTSLGMFEKTLSLPYPNRRREYLIFLVRDYMFGKSRMPRWIVGLVALVVFIVVHALGLLRDYVDPLQIDRVESLSIFLYIVGLELPIWYFRIKRNVELKLVDALLDAQADLPEPSVVPR